MMIYLLLNVAFASTFTLSIKWVQVRAREDIMIVGAINYLVAAGLILPRFRLLPRSDVDPLAVLTGASMGFCYFVAFFVLNFTIRRIGAASATVIGVLSIIVPIACGVWIWREDPSVFQTVGIVLALVSLSLVGGHRSKPKPDIRNWQASLIMLSFFVLAGTSRLSQEAFKHLCDPGQRPTFLASAFLTTAVPSVPLLLSRRRWFRIGELLIGILMGVANIVQLFFVLKALEHYPGFVVFPIASAGNLILTTVVATRLLGERLNHKTRLGIAVAVVALVLLNYTAGE